MSFNKRNYGISSNDIAAILEGGVEAGPALFWRDLLTNQLDADRMDYLLRDHTIIGVSYGKYDLARLVATIVAYRDSKRTSQGSEYRAVGGTQPRASLWLATRCLSRFICIRLESPSISILEGLLNRCCRAAHFHFHR